MLFWLSCLVLALAVVFCGATHAGYAGDVFLQLISIPLLTAALWPALSSRDPRRGKGRLVLFLCITIALVTLVQILPLPFDIWREGVPLFSWQTGTEFEPAKRGWGTFSLGPQSTWVAAVSFIVPLSIFGAVIHLGNRQRLILSWLLLGLGALTLVLGFLQVAQGPGSSLRFYEITNDTEAVGFFANRNHFAALLYISLVLAGVWLATLGEGLFSDRAINSRSILRLAAAAALLVAIMAGLAAAKSRAGIVLAMIALAGIFAIAVRQRRAPPASALRHGLSARRTSFAIIFLGILFTAQFGLSGILTRFQADATADLRVPFNAATWKAVPKALPLGTGLGTFVPVYSAVENRQDVFAGFANRAHNDLAEFLLETGVMGGLLVAVFLAWFARRSYEVWTTQQASESLTRITLERGSTLVIFLLLAHSLVDYPLRTTALSCIFAYFCAVLAVPAPDIHSGSGTPERRREQVYPAPYEPSLGERWGSGTDWPESWQKPPA